MGHPRQKLMRDQRGAIAASGIFMATFMAATLFYVVGIGDAAIHHERMQDAADQGAYTSAVYHARGMNVTSMGNVTIAAQFAVKLSLDISKILDRIELGILIASCVFNWSDCAYIPVDISLNALLQQLLSRLQGLIFNQMNFLSMAQAQLAKMAGFLAQARSFQQMLRYASHIDLGSVLSLSLLPRGKRLGLPIQEDKETVLCQKARSVIPIIALKPLLYMSMPLYVGGFVIGVTAGVAGSSCSSSESTGKNPKRVFDEAWNGNKYFQCYGYGIHVRDVYKKYGDKGTDLAAWGRGEAARAAARLRGRIMSLMRLGVTDAEYYYDERGKWRGMKDAAMWNMRWRARLRRYQRMPTELTTMVVMNMGEKFEDAFDDIIH